MATSPWFRVALLISVVGLGTVAWSGGYAAEKSELPEFLKKQQHEEPLRFASISVVKRGQHEATVVWETNHPASGRLRFGTNPAMKNSRTRMTPRSRHRFRLTDLREGTRYGFRVYAWDGSKHRIKSQVVFFRTRGTPPPEVKRVRVVKRTLEGGIVRWVTNTPTRAVFESGYDTPLRFKTVHDSPTRFHQVTLKRFHPNRDILYRITSVDTRGRRRLSGIRRLRTRENNVAWEKPVRGTFDRPIFGVPEDARGETPYQRRVNDGRFDYQLGTATSGDPADTVQRFTINLEKLHRPGRAVLYWRDLAYPEKYSIHGSRTGRKWDVLARNLNAAKGKHTRKGGILSYRQVVEFDTDRAYQFIRVEIPKGAPYYGKYPQYKFVQLQEFKLFPRSDSYGSARPDPTSTGETR